MSEQTFTKQAGDYSTNVDDFRADAELMVTITLHEYRDLLNTKAQLDYRISKKDDELWQMRKERDEANKRVESLLQALNGEDGEADGDD